MRTLPTTVRLGTAAGALALLAAGLLPGAAAAQTTGLDVIGLGGGGTRLLSFSTDAPAGRVLPAVTGLNAGATLVGIDHRALDGVLYGVSTDGYIYSLVPATGRATLANTSQVPLDGSPSYGVDFNPAANALRITSSQGQNLRVPFATPNAAAVTDVPLTRPVGTDPAVRQPALGVTAGAYTNTDVDPATATELLVLDTQRDQLGSQTPANNGTINPVGPLRVNFAAASAGFDIYTSGATNAGYAVTGGNLYTVDLVTGRATLVGKVGNVVDLAIPLNQG